MFLQASVVMMAPKSREHLTHLTHDTGAADNWQCPKHTICLDSRAPGSIKHATAVLLWIYLASLHRSWAEQHPAFSLEWPLMMSAHTSIVTHSGSEMLMVFTSTSEPILAPINLSSMFCSGVPRQLFSTGVAKASRWRPNHQRKYTAPHSGCSPAGKRPTCRSTSKSFLAITVCQRCRLLVKVHHQQCGRCSCSTLLVGPLQHGR